MQLHQVFYISRATLPMSTDVENIIAESRARNAPLQLTGALVFSGEFFAQVLEGFPEDVERLMCSIRRDRRHSILWEWPSRAVAERWYPDWSMGHLQNDNLEAVVDHLSESPGPLPPLEYFVRWLISTSRLNKRSRTAAVPPA